MTRRAVERVLTALIDLGVDINSHVATSLGGSMATEYRESFDAAAAAGMIPVDLADRLKPSVGLRNVLIHEYVALNLSRVAAAVPLTRSGYGEYVRTVAGWLRSASG